ncbi:MAG: kinase/pyrophosphorylase [Rickettsiales bacterium]|jgi:[pyruvate, water dikinase]-phosphate phosphotransferase / [pyruvate, water dikinase] kinase|nr:kinase/pyrophosphorylase [Rickettsiales bacterium]
MSKQINLHLISDSTGETLISMSRAVLSQFANIEVNEHVWSLVRGEVKVDKIIESIRKNPGIVLYTILDERLLKKLVEYCEANNLPCIAALDNIIHKFSRYIGEDVVNHPGRQYKLDDDYFNRIDAINFTISHDDGQKLQDVEKSDVIIVGPSRTSKSPTCIYLAYRGIKAANVPFVHEVVFSKKISELKNKLVVGFSIDPEILIQIRKTRMRNIGAGEGFSYIDIYKVKEEILAARRLYLENNWPIIDISRKSVEETATSIIQMYHNMKS